MANKVIGA